MRGPRRSPSKRSGYKPFPSNEATARTLTIPAPVGGWNARDSLSAMRPLDAVVMDNILPGTSDVSLRPGTIDWLTSLAEKAQSLLVYNSASTSKLFVSTNSGIYDASSQGAVGAAVTSCTDGKWEFVNFSNSGGSFLVAVNGVDDMKNYNGTTWTDINGVSTPALTGVNTNVIFNLALHKRRIWMVERNSTDLWYLPADAIAGAATIFPVGPVFTRGGSIIAIASWTVDGGTGSDDLFVIATTQGEIAVYQGTDPASSTTWALVGVYYAGQPLNKKCFVKYGGDLLYLGQQGLYPLSKLLLSATLDKTYAISFKIDGAFVDAASQWGTIFGWEMIIYPNANYLLVNVPFSIEPMSYQYVMNNITKAWCRFTAWNATCFALYNGSLYYGDGDSVKLAWTGVSDSGQPISGRVAQAYNNLGYSGQKNVSLARPNISIEGSATLSFALDADYKSFEGFTERTYMPQGNPALWDSSDWDDSVWDAGFQAVESRWITVPNDLGYLYSFRLQLTTSSSRFSWTSTDLAVRSAGIL